MRPGSRPGLFFTPLAGPRAGPDPSASPPGQQHRGLGGAKRCQYGRETDVQIVHTLRTNKYAMKGFACDRLVELT